MEIGPITGIRNQPALRPKETFLGLPGIFEVENSSRIDDETDSPSSAKAAGGYEDEDDAQEEDVYEHGQDENEDEDEEQPRPRAKTISRTEDGPVSYFA